MKANPKTKADPKADAAPASGSKKKLMIMAIAGMLVLGGGAGAGWFFLHGSGDAEAAHADEAPKKKKKKEKSHAKAEYIPVESFTVNLQPENGDQYLQIQFTLQVDGPEQVTVIKDNMAKVRSRVLLLLSGKKPSEINTVDGKQQLAAEIKAVVQQPFEEGGNEQDVSDVLFTSFIIQ